MVRIVKVQSFDNHEKERQPLKFCKVAMDSPIPAHDELDTAE